MLRWISQYPHDVNMVRLSPKYIVDHYIHHKSTCLSYGGLARNSHPVESMLILFRS